MEKWQPMEAGFPMATGSGGTELPFDYEASLARLDNDPKLFRDMVQFFHEDSPELVRQIRESVGSGDAHLAERAAHSIKGLAATFDADATIRAAQRIEEMARSGALLDIPAAVEILEREVVRLNRALDESLG
jgi:HPt (histidine-containing phosphotransfer) domain-containing protein